MKTIVKRYLGLCLLWVCTVALWAQTDRGYSGDYDPTNPAHPSGKPTYQLSVNVEGSGSVGIVINDSTMITADAVTTGHQFEIGATAILVAFPQEGYRFVCWKSGTSELSNDTPYSYIMPAEDTELTAVFVYDPDTPVHPDVIPNSYYVTAETYPAHAGTVSNTRMRVPMGTPTEIVAYNREHYKFKSWICENGTVSSDACYKFEMPAEDIHLVALFEYAPDNPEHPDFHPIFKLSYIVDGEVYRTDSVRLGTRLIPLEPPVKEGYTFSGWTGLPDIMPSHDVTVVGTFVVDGYTLTYKVDGEIYKTAKYKYGESILPEELPTKEGHTFSGWSGIPETMPAENVTVMGTFTVNTYKVTYMVDGKVHQTDFVAYGSTIIPLENPIKEGHIFSGWNDIPETMPAEDVIITGAFSINTYKVTYIIDEEVYHTDIVAYGSVITVPEYPVKEGYIFSGWNEIPETMPAEDVTIAGVFVLNATQTDAQGLVYKLNETADAFVVSDYTEMLVDEVVIPAELYGLPITRIAEKSLIGAGTLKSLIIPSNVVEVGENVFYGCNNLLFVEWNTPAPLNVDCFEAPERHGNMLVFVTDASTEVAYQGNVIVNGVAEKITLTEGLPFRNTREFTARRMSYTHEFTKKTKRGVASGWEALVLPFDVQTVTSEEKGALLPFGKADFTASLPYWVAEFQSDGTFAYVDAIKANTPFIMEVPNSDEYEEIYNIQGNVTFSAENVVVHATTSMQEPSGSNYALVGCYEGIESGSRVYALNDEEYTLEDGSVGLAGSVFVENSRDVRPFEAYVYGSQPSRAPYLRIGGKEGTGIGHMLLLTDEEAWYTLQGIRLNSKPKERGVYIVNGRKVMIK